MREVIKDQSASNVTHSINGNLDEGAVGNRYPHLNEVDLQKELTIKDNEIKVLEKEIVNLQNTILILENDLELNILQNIETIIKQEEFLLEMNAVFSTLNMKNENYQNIIVQKNKEIKKIESRYEKLRTSKAGSFMIKYWTLRKNILSR